MVLRIVKQSYRHILALIAGLIVLLSMWSTTSAEKTAQIYFTFDKVSPVVAQYHANSLEMYCED